MILGLNGRNFISTIIMSSKYITFYFKRFILATITPEIILLFIKKNNGCTLYLR